MMTRGGLQGIAGRSLKPMSGKELVELDIDHGAGGVA